MSEPAVSVIIATYRRDKSLVAALDSLTKQTFSEFEIILVDDNDEIEWNKKTEEIVKKFKNKYPYIEIQYIQNHPNQGSAKTRNIGISVARGEFVTFLDDDDIYLPKKIEKQYKSMCSADADYSITDLYLYNEKNKLIERRVRDYLQNSSADRLIKYHLMYHMTGTDAMMFRRKYLLHIGGFDEIDVGDEFYLMQKAIDGRGRFSYLPDCDLKAYVHTGENGLSSGQSKVNGENQLYEYKKKYFSKIDASSQRYIRMRHYAVLAFAYIRMKKYNNFLGNAMKAFASAPISCTKLVVEMIIKRKI